MIDFNKKCFHILCVDDTQTNLDLLKQLLDKHGYAISTVDSGEDAIRFLNKDSDVDLILLDIMMPGIDGYTVCQSIKACKNKIAKIPIIFLTAVDAIEGITRGFEVGGVDYITKPFHPQELLMRVKTHLQLKFYKDRDAEDTQRELVYIMSEIADKHSKETSNHVHRVSEYSKLMAKLLGYDEERAEMIRLAAAMHDIGKVGIPDHILNKQGTLDDDEFEIVKKHTMTGYDILKNSKLPLFKISAIIAHQHHEKWDGSGYPRGLKGEEINILGRIVALADVFDALSSSRTYKKGWSTSEIFAFLKSKSGIHFEPRMVELFMDNFGLFLDIRDRYDAHL